MTPFYCGKNTLDDIPLRESLSRDCLTVFLDREQHGPITETKNCQWLQENKRNLEKFVFMPVTNAITSTGSGLGHWHLEFILLLFPFYLPIIIDYFYMVKLI
jgi:hypothetical protein